jgi:hypothetical protein
MLDYNQVKLGRNPSRQDTRTLRLAHYLTPALPAPPPAVDWSAKLAAIGMMGNDVYGDCTCAAMGHAEQVWTADNGPEVTVPDAAVLGAYEAVSGFQPGDSSTDTGADMLTVAKYWRQTGIAGHTIEGFTTADPTKATEVQVGLWVLGGLYTGVALPRSAQAQIKAQQPWDVPPGGPYGDGTPNSWGGHCVWTVAYDAQGLTCLTWGQKQRMTWAFWQTYVEECLPILAPEWHSAGKCPAGFDVTTLQADIAALTANPSLALAGGYNEVT